MRIEHLALWVEDIEIMKDFYVKHFNATSSEKYQNIKKEFQSYFLTFSSGARLEIMHHPTVRKGDSEIKKSGYAHFAFSLGSEEEVNRFTSQLKESGFKIIDGPRHTGDGYYESAFLDPENNIIEITV